MAARLYPAPYRPTEIVDLRRLAARDLEPLLREEIDTWRRDLDWDFEKSADLVRRFVDLHALNGLAMMEDGEVVGYLYYVLEDNKGLIGDLYLRRAVRTLDLELNLLETGLECIMGTPAIDRIESQLMMLGCTGGYALPGQRFLSAFERVFMHIDLRACWIGDGRARRPLYIEKWSDQFQDAASQLIASAYDGHIDSWINDQYRSEAGARRFLSNIVQYPGCGSFFRPASYAAFDAITGQMIGVSLASLVAPECGHITQICTAPEVRGTGVGHTLLQRSLMTLRETGCRSASLTVTAANREAVKLYERIGFYQIRRFSAFVWEGF